MQSTQGSTNGATIAISVVVIVLIAVGVWWYLGARPAGTAAQNTSPSAPASGQLEGTVRAQ